MSFLSFRKMKMTTDVCKNPRNKSFLIRRLPHLKFQIPTGLRLNLNYADIFDNDLRDPIILQTLMNVLAVHMTVYLTLKFVEILLVPMFVTVLKIFLETQIIFVKYNVRLIRFRIPKIKHKDKQKL